MTTELIVGSAWKEYLRSPTPSGTSVCSTMVLTISDGDISFEGTPNPYPTTYTGCNVGVEHPAIDFTCLDEITFDYDSTYNTEGTTTISFRIDNDVVWSIKNTTTSGSATIDVSAYTGSHVLRFVRSSMADPYAYDPWVAGAYMDTYITNISALADYVDPILTSVSVDETSGEVPIDLEYTAVVDYAGSCPATTTAKWTIYKDGEVFLDNETDNPLTVSVTQPGTYQGKFTLANSRITLTEYTDETLLGVDTYIGFTTDKVVSNTTEPIYFRSECYDSYGYPDKNWSFEWYFGDGTTSVEEHPVHTYDTEGTYTVSFWADSEHYKSKYEMFGVKSGSSSGFVALHQTLSPALSITNYDIEKMSLNFSIRISDVDNFDTLNMVRIGTWDSGLVSYTNSIYYSGIYAYLLDEDVVYDVSIPLTDFTDDSFDETNINRISFYFSFDSPPADVTVEVFNAKLVRDPVTTTIEIDNDATRGHYSCLPKNRYGILVLDETTPANSVLLFDGYDGIRLSEVEVSHEIGKLSTAGFTVYGLSDIDGYADLFVNRREVYIINQDSVLFSGYISDVETKTNDFYGNTSDVKPGYRFMCEGSCSILKTISYSGRATLFGNPVRLFEQVVPTGYHGAITPPSMKDVSRTLSVNNSNIYNIISSLSDSSGYVMKDYSTTYIVGGLLTETDPDLVSGDYVMIPGEVADMVSVGDYVIYLKRNILGGSHIDTSRRNAWDRFYVSGVVTAVKDDYIGDNDTYVKFDPVTPIDDIEEPIGSDLRSYMDYCVVMFVRAGRQAVSFGSGHNTNLIRQVDLGTQLVDTNTIDTEYINYTNYSISTSSDGRKSAASLPACVVVDEQGFGDHHTYVDYQLGSEVVAKYSDSTYLKGHNLFDTEDLPTAFTFVYNDGDTFVISSYTPAAYDVSEGYLGNVPVTVVGFVDSSVQVGAYVSFNWSDTTILNLETRLYVKDLGGSWTPNKFVSIGTTSYEDQAYKIISVEEDYLIIRLHRLYTTPRIEYYPKLPGCIVYKLADAVSNPYSIDNPESGSPVDTHGIKTKILSGGSGMGIPELEVVASGYISRSSNFTDIAKGKLYDIHSFYSEYPLVEYPTYYLNHPLKAGDRMEVRFNDETREYTIWSSTHKLDKGYTEFELGGGKNDIVGAINTALSTQDISL